MGILDTLLGRNKVKIKAVHPEDLEDVLSSFDKLEPVRRGEIECSICSETITTENIGKICPSKDGVGLVCDKSCYLMGASDSSTLSDSGGSTENEKDEETETRENPQPDSSEEDPETNKTTSDGGNQDEQSIRGGLF